LTQRILVAVLIGLAAASLHYFKPGSNGGPSDFSTVWYGSSFIGKGLNPYSLVGPHRVIDLPSPVFYPAPALVAVLPLTVLSAEHAGVVFVFISAALLAFGATRESWYLLPLFPSVPFLTSARLGQWSMLMTAALYIPVIAALAICKPQASIPVVAASTEKKTWLAGGVGGSVLLVLSFILMPAWPTEWMKLLRSAEYFRAPIMTIVGVPIAAVLIRWRRPEAWLIFTAACLPQTWYPYNALILLAVAATYREACVLSLISSAGWFVTYAFFAGAWRSAETQLVMQYALILFGYLPATFVVLRRPGSGPSPLWLQWLMPARSRA
jgi:hypothetical protein